MDEQQKIFNEQRAAQRGLADLLLQNAESSQKQRLTAQNDAYRTTMQPNLEAGLAAIFSDDSPEEKQEQAKTLLQQQKELTPKYEAAMANTYTKLDPTQAASLAAQGVKMGLNYDTASKMTGDYVKNFNDSVKSNQYDRYANIYNTTTDPQEKLRAAFNMAATDNTRMPLNDLLAIAGKKNVPVNNGAGQLVYQTDILGNFDTDVDGRPQPALAVPNYPNPGQVLASNTQKEIAQIHENGQTMRQLKQLGATAKMAEQQKAMMYRQILLDASKWQGDMMNEGRPYPYPELLEEAQAYFGSGGRSGQASAGQPGNQDPIGDWIRRAKQQGASAEQIKQALHDKGYGDSYDSWVW